MFISEIFEPAQPGLYTAKDDNSVLKMSDTRKTRLTLAQLNRLRMMNDVLKFEHEKQLERVSKQYKPPVDASAMGMGAPASL
jgi:hypothetical protein